MLSGFEALPVFKDRSTRQTLQAEMMMEGIGLERGWVGGLGALESLREELAEK